LTAAAGSGAAAPQAFSLFQILRMRCALEPTNYLHHVPKRSGFAGSEAVAVVGGGGDQWSFSFAEPLCILRAAKMRQTVR